MRMMLSIDKRIEDTKRSRYRMVDKKVSWYTIGNPFCGRFVLSATNLRCKGLNTWKK